MCDCIERLREQADIHRALAREWHDDHDLLALGFDNAADHLEETTPR